MTSNFLPTSKVRTFSFIPTMLWHLTSFQHFQPESLGHNLFATREGGKTGSHRGHLSPLTTPSGSAATRRGPRQSRKMTRKEKGLAAWILRPNLFRNRIMKTNEALKRIVFLFFLLRSVAKHHHSFEQRLVFPEGLASGCGANSSQAPISFRLTIREEGSEGHFRPWKAVGQCRVTPLSLRKRRNCLTRVSIQACARSQHSLRIVCCLLGKKRSTESSHPWSKSLLKRQFG